MHKAGMISIWFFIGVLLVAYGVLTIGAGLYELVTPPAQPTVLAELHAGVWWGAFILALGAFYSWHFRPRPD
jgi:hypothetical protein